MKPVREASGFAKFRLLLWKNFLLQIRNPIQNLYVMVLPSVMIVIIILIRYPIPRSSERQVVYPAISAYNLDNDFTAMIWSQLSMNVSELSVAYSPTSPILEDVISSSMATIIGKNQFLSLLLPNPNMITVKGYDRAEELSDIYNDEIITREVLAAVQFDDSLLGAEMLPEDVSFSLRFPQRPRLNSFFGIGGRSWQTPAVFPSIALSGPRSPLSLEGGNDPGYVFEMFIALQHAISTELTVRLTGEDLRDFSMNIQRYPHPEYVQDAASDLLSLLLPLFIMIGTSFPVSYMIQSITTEKELQLKETMKIMGVSTWLHWTAWFVKEFLCLMVTVIVTVILLKVEMFSAENGSNYAIISYSPWSLLFVFLTLYVASATSFSFMISSFFSKATTATMFMGVIWLLSYLPAFLLFFDTPVPFVAQGAMCLSLNVALMLGFINMLTAENLGGLQWGQIMTNSSQADRIPFGAVLIILAFDIVLYMMITLYIEKICPGPYGAPQPWYFPFQRSFWCKKITKYIDGTDNDFDHEIIKEEDPTDLKLGVKISKLTKVYGANIAVNKFSLNIYNDQITVLLGHNGAGKSTVMSMLTGNIEATSGTAVIAGYDIRRQTAAARAHIGFCPQHNILFKELTVREHLEFFARLKGFTGKELDENIDSIMEKLEMQEKRNSRSSLLSGGQKRRLSVGVALCGATDVVLLDEPTSGMDPSSRRALWDLLQKEKKGRTVILTTHFMDEADILGDRVVIMASGRLQCVGSPYFLKRHYGVGYTLVVVKGENFNEHVCTKIIAKYIPDISVKEDRGSEVTYSLKSDYTHVYENIINDLENNTTTIGFINHGLIATTLEDVFMSVGSSHDVTTQADDISLEYDTENENVLGLYTDQIASTTNHSKDKFVTGFSLKIQQLLTMWVKLWLIWSRSWGVVLMQILVPILFMCFMLITLRFVVRFESDPEPRLLSLSVGFPSTQTWLQFNGSDSTSRGALATKAYEDIYVDQDNMALRVVDEPIGDLYLNEGNDPSTMAVLRNELLTGASFGDNEATAWFSNFGYHDVAVSLATVHSAILKSLRPTAKINVTNYPLHVNYEEQDDLQVILAVVSIQVSTAIANSLGIISAVFVMFYVKERKCRAKLLQQSCGVSPLIIWGGAAIFDWIWFIILCSILVICCVAFQVIGLSSGSEIGWLYLCFMVYGAAMLPLNYVFSHIFSKPSRGFMMMYMLNIVMGMVGNQIVSSLSIGFDGMVQASQVLDYVLQIHPLYSTVASISNLNAIGIREWYCMDYCSRFLELEECNMQTACDYMPLCCMSETPQLDWRSPGITRYLVFMIGLSVLLWIIHFLIEYRILQRIFSCRRTGKPLDETTMDSDVVDEIRHVEQLSGSTLGERNLVAKSLTKYYRKNLAVNQVSFTVGESECFGLLGANGAGKTTTFKMLMGDESVSNGDAYVRGHSVRTSIAKVHRNIGYCPQFDGVFGELTGRETLRIFALLCGYKRHTIPGAIHRLANELCFTEHLDKRINQYSGGNKRKLSVALSMMGVSPIMFLDEPTTGVDPAAKRQVWKEIRRATHSGRGVVLTSHSMEECEALCSRLTIMVNGQFQCLGTPQHLKNKFSQGFLLTIKIKSQGSAGVAEDNSHLEAVKTYISTNFQDPELKEEYKGLLTYYLKSDDLRWSRMFGIMETAKRELQLEDYTISQTTLEQVFLQFTKYQKEEENTPEETANVVNTT